MDKDRILNKLKAIQAKALTAAAWVLVAEIEPFIPINVGVGPDSIKGSRRVTAGPDGVEIGYGGSGKSQNYAAYQYFVAKQHNFKNGAMARLLDLLHGDARERASGLVDEKRYPIAYTQADSEGTLTKFPNGARWFDIVLNDKEVQHRAWVTYANALRAA